MGIQTATTTTYECDRCKFSSGDPFARGGHAKLTLQITSRAYNGDIGGGTQVWDWLCGKCTNELRAFLREPA